MKQKSPPKINFALGSPDQLCAGLASHCEAHRIAKGMTQRQLAGRAGIGMRTVVRFEKTGRADFETFVRILQALRLTDRLEALQFSAERQSPLQALTLSGDGNTRGRAVK